MNQSKTNLFRWISDDLVSLSNERRDQSKAFVLSNGDRKPLPPVFQKFLVKIFHILKLVFDLL